MQKNEWMPKALRLLLISLWPWSWFAAIFLLIAVNAFPSDPSFYGPATDSPPYAVVATAQIVWTSIIVGLQILGSVMIWRAADPISMYVRLTCVSSCALLGAFSAYQYYSTVPSYIVPFLAHCPLVILAFIIWQALGLLALYKARTFPQWILSVVAFSVPLVALMRVGPYLLVITKWPLEAGEFLSRHYVQNLYKLDNVVIAAVLLVACLSFSGLWISLLNRRQEKQLTPIG